MRINAVRIIQRELQARGLYAGRIDGKRGPQTNAAINAALAQQADQLSDDFSGWSAKRKAIAFLQWICADNGIDVGPIDGLWGPQTEYAYGSLVHLIDNGVLPPLWRDETPLDVNPNGWPRQSQADLTAFYGEHCEVPLRKVKVPWELKLAWQLRTTVTHISCHEKVADSLARVLDNVHAHYGDSEIERLGLNLYGGCFNCRKKRGGSTWSTHAWAISIDWDPSHNQFRWGRDRARMAGPDYDDWWRFWEEEGWVSLGRTKNFDWMHIQAAKL